jgi:hypothetical protein
VPAFEPSGANSSSEIGDTSRQSGPKPRGVVLGQEHRSRNVLKFPASPLTQRSPAIPTYAHVPRVLCSPGPVRICSLSAPLRGAASWQSDGGHRFGGEVRGVRCRGATCPKRRDRGGTMVRGEVESLSRNGSYQSGNVDQVVGRDEECDPGVMCCHRNTHRALRCAAGTMSGDKFLRGTCSAIVQFLAYGRDGGGSIGCCAREGADPFG